VIKTVMLYAQFEQKLCQPRCLWRTHSDMQQARLAVFLLVLDLYLFAIYSLISRRVPLLRIELLQLLLSPILGVVGVLLGLLILLLLALSLALKLLLSEHLVARLDSLFTASARCSSLNR